MLVVAYEQGRSQRVRGSSGAEKPIGDRVDRLAPELAHRYGVEPERSAVHVASEAMGARAKVCEC